jgi:hypothetical protein
MLIVGGLYTPFVYKSSQAEPTKIHPGGCTSKWTSAEAKSIQPTLHQQKAQLQRILLETVWKIARELHDSGIEGGAQRLEEASWPLIAGSQATGLGAYPSFQTVSLRLGRFNTLAIHHPCAGLGIPFQTDPQALADRPVHFLLNAANAPFLK